MHFRLLRHLVEEIDPAFEVVVQVDRRPGVIDLVFFNQVAQVVVDRKDVFDGGFDLGKMAVLAVFHRKQFDIGDDDAQRGVGLVDGMAQKLLLRRQQRLGKVLRRLQVAVFDLERPGFLPDLLLQRSVELLKLPALFRERAHHVVGVKDHFFQLVKKRLVRVHDLIRTRRAGEEIEKGAHVAFQQRVDDLADAEAERKKDEGQRRDLEDDADQHALHLLLAAQHLLVGGGSIDARHDAVAAVQRPRVKQRRLFAALHRDDAFGNGVAVEIDAGEHPRGNRPLAVQHRAAGGEQVDETAGRFAEDVGEMDQHLLKVRFALGPVDLEIGQRLDAPRHLDDLVVLAHQVEMFLFFERLAELFGLVVDQQGGEQHRE